MIKKHRLIKSIAFIVVFSFILNILPTTQTIYSYADDQINVFEDNRFLKNDGTKYIRIKDVTESGARVIIYEANPDIAFSTNYQPDDSAIIAEWNYAFDVVPESFNDPDISACIDEMLIFSDNEGSMALYLAPDGKTLYARDSTGDFVSSQTPVTGTYIYVPYVTEKNHTSEYTEIRIWPDSSNFGEDWRKKVDITQVGSIYVEEPDRIEKIGEKNFDEYYWETSLKELAECSFIRFLGVAWIDEANIGNDTEYRSYHLNKRKPWKDSELCKNSDDEDIVISTRRNVFLRQKGKKTSTELLYYYDSTSEKGFLGLYVENGSKDEEDVSLSWGESSVGYYFNDIDWYEMKNSKSGSWDVTVDEDTNTILLEGETEPKMHYSGGIAYHLSYKIWIYFNDDGTIDAEGYVIADGEGTEELIYGIKAGAVEFQSNTLVEETNKLVKQQYTYDIMEEIPGNLKEIPEYEVTETTETTYITEIISVIYKSKTTHYNDWPDDTDPAKTSERRAADEDTVYGYSYDKDSGQSMEWEDIGTDESDMSNVQKMAGFKYAGQFLAVDANETYGAFLSFEEDGFVIFITGPMDDEETVMLFDGYYDYAYSKDSDGIHDMAKIRMVFNNGVAGHEYAEALYSEQYDRLFFLTPGYGKMGKDANWEGVFDRIVY